jgi:hypothetical protein
MDAVRHIEARARGAFALDGRPDFGLTACALARQAGRRGPSADGAKYEAIGA